jgi:uncharacterized protein (DUF427 family)
MKAVWNGKIIAESNETVIVEGNHYFPQDALNKEFILESSTHTTCPWKGIASYYSLIVDGKENRDSVWYYPEPSEKAMNIKGKVAFWKGVEISN